MSKPCNLLVHIGFKHVQWLIHTGRLKAQVNSKAVTNCKIPQCAAREFGKGHCLSNKVKTINKNPIKEQDINKDHILLGHIVYADNYISRAPDRLYHTKGRSYPSGMFSSGCVLLTVPVVM